MRVRANNEIVEFYCEFCQKAEAVKDDLTPTGFMRKFNAFRRKHEQQCQQIAKRDVAIETAIKTTDKLIQSVAGIDVAPDIKGTREDPHYEQARSLVLSSRKASISYVQRNLRIGYNHAARLIQAMEGDIIGPPGKEGVRFLL